MKKIDVVILAGGVGSRLKSVVDDRNKVTACVGGRPFITFILDRLVQHAFDEVILCCGYKGDALRSELGEQYGDLHLVYSMEKIPLGTAGALKNAEPLLEGDPILVLNGDSYCDLNLRALISHHAASDACATLAAVRVDDVSRYGSLGMGPKGKIVSFSEKSARTGGGYINGGVYAMEPALLGSIPLKKAVSLEYEMFPLWMSDGLDAYLHNGMFIDIGTPESYLRAQTYLKR